MFLEKVSGNSCLDQDSECFRRAKVWFFTPPKMQIFEGVEGKIYTVGPMPSLLKILPGDEKPCLWF